jgi:hypothetical protein
MHGEVYTTYACGSIWVHDMYQSTMGVFNSLYIKKTITFAIRGAPFP